MARVALHICLQLQTGREWSLVPFGPAACSAMLAAVQLISTRLHLLCQAEKSSLAERSGLGPHHPLPRFQGELV